MATTTLSDGATTTESSSSPRQQHHQTCPVCGKKGSKRCSRCLQVYYCSSECQRQHWKKTSSGGGGGHKTFCDSVFQSNQYELHKKAFDVIVEKYGLNREDKATEIASLLTHDKDKEGMSAQDFAEKFGMDLPEAVTFLEWIKLGVRFKEQTIDTAKRAGLAGIGGVSGGGGKKG